MFSNSRKQLRLNFQRQIIMSKEKLYASTQNINVEDINQQDKRGNTALHRAVLNGGRSYVSVVPDFKTIEVLLSKGADIQVKNNFGFTPDKLIFALSDQKPLEEGFAIYNREKICKLEEQYFNSVLNYQPTFENIRFFLEQGSKYLYQILVSQLSQDCLEKLASWCKEGLKIYKEKIKPVPNEPNIFSLNDIPKHLTNRMQLEELLKDCQNELDLLKDYPRLNQTIEKIIAPCYREAVLTALMQDNNIKVYFSGLTDQLDQLSLSKELKQGVNKLSNDLNERVKLNYPQLTCLNDEGKEFIYSLFNELIENVFERGVEIDTQLASQSKWSDQIANGKVKQMVERYNEPKTEHENCFKKVIVEFSKYQEDIQKNGAFGENSFFTLQVKRNRCAAAAERRQDLTNLDQNLSQAKTIVSLNNT